MSVPDWLTSTPVAHRGLHRKPDLPENSLGAFEAARDAGFAMEMDIHLAADGSIAIFHDSDLARMTGSPGKLAEQNRDSLRTLRLGGTEFHIPVFEELLALVAGRTPLLIEVKNEGKVGPLESALAKLLDDYKGPFAVQSFNPFSMGWFAKNRPHYPRGQISGSYRGWPTTISEWRKFVLRNLLLCFVSRPDFIAYELGAMTPLRRFYIRTFFPRPLLLWTARSAPDLEFCRGIQANPIFENVAADVARRILA